MKNKFILIITLLLLSLPISVNAINTDVTSMNSTIPAEELTTEEMDFDMAANDSIKEEQALTEEQSQSTIPFKQPVSKKQLLKKFIFAMFLIGVFSLVLYFGLNLYNKVKNNIALQVKTPEGETPLSSPKDFDDAVKIFLNKTKW